MFKKVGIMVLSAVILSQSISVSARPPGGPGGHGPGPGPYRGWPGPWGCPRPGFPYVPVIVGGLSLLYSAGLFYQCVSGNYVIVAPPTGALIPVLPAGYNICVINGVTYYYCNSTYYVSSAGGYVVVAPPATTVIQQSPPVTVVQQSAPVTVQQTVPSVQQVQPQPAAQPAATAPANTSTDDHYDVYISNGNGTFTVVRLRKTEKGFLGPQGEFYPDHPTEAQLKARYVKQ